MNNTALGISGLSSKDSKIDIIIKIRIIGINSTFILKVRIVMKIIAAVVNAIPAAESNIKKKLSTPDSSEFRQPKIKSEVEVSFKNSEKK